jgi:hypothetical protein
MGAGSDIFSRTAGGKGEKQEGCSENGQRTHGTKITQESRV